MTDRSRTTPRVEPHPRTGAADHRPRRPGLGLVWLCLLMAHVGLLASPALAQDAPVSGGLGMAAKGALVVDAQEQDEAPRLRGTERLRPGFAQDAGGDEAPDAEGGDEAPPAEPGAAPAPESPAAGPAKDLPGNVQALPGDSPEVQAEFEAFQRAYADYQAEIIGYRNEVDAIVEAEYQRKRSQISQVYDKEIKGLEAIEREKRKDAIAALEAFLRKYPNNKEYTPDVMYRLAELYFEKANDDYLLADERYQQEMELYENGRVADPPVTPERNYDRPIALFRGLIKRFPDYRFVDGAYYLLGFCLIRVGEDEEAKVAFERLTKEKPKSRFVPEAWVRIGEFHFDSNELDEAIAAYSQALNYEKNPFYDKALYKLAWTYYRADRFDDAIKSFQKLIRYADKQAEETGRTGSELREEAVQYLAISLAEEDWDGDGEPDPEFGMERVSRYMKGEKYERDVLGRLGNIFFDNTRYDQAIESYRMALKTYPLDPNNPEIHDKMVLALQRMRRFDEAFEERRKTGVYYGPGSEWHEAQKREGNLEALAFADKLARDNLIESATWFHEQAQKTAEEAANRDDAALSQKAVGLFDKAAVAYADYIKKYPHDRESYKWNYYKAECLFYSLKFVPAAEAYAFVRELDQGENEFREPAAFNGIKAHENHVKLLIQEGTLPAKSLPDGSAPPEDTPEPDGNGDDGRGGKAAVMAVEPEKLPGEVDALNGARMRYVALGLTSKEEPDLPAKLELAVAKSYYDFHQYGEARTRLSALVEKYKKSNSQIAAVAAALILESFVMVQDYDNMALWADKIAQDPDLKNSKRALEVQNEAKRLKLGAMFKKAEDLDNQGKYEEAAEAYVQLVNSDPQNAYAAKALNNAAVAYEKVKRFESAMKLYERVFQQYPKSELASYALFRVAFNAERFFDFDKATRSYLLLVDRYKDSDDREGALLKAGIVLENVQDYNKAANTYKRFAREYPDSKDAPLTLYQAAMVYEKMKDYPRMIQTLEDFNKRYGGAKYNTQVMTGLDKIADYHLNVARNKRDAAAAFNRIIREHDARQIARASPDAQYAAKATFYLAEFEFEKWDAIQLKGSLKAQERALKSKLEGAQALRPRYEKVYDYGNLEWTMAAGFRTANILQRFAQSLFNAEIPFEEGSEEYDMYITTLEDIALPLEDDAVKDYEKTLAKAREEKIVNAWTKKVLEQLNKYRPSQYPLFHEEKQELQTVPLTSTGPISPMDLAPKGDDAPPEDDGDPVDDEDDEDAK